MITTTLTPAQAHAIVCAGGIQPHSITPEAALALLQRNASAHAAWCEAHGVIDGPARRAVATLDGCAPVIHLPYSAKGIHALDISAPVTSWPRSRWQALPMSPTRPRGRPRPNRVKLP